VGEGRMNLGDVECAGACLRPPWLKLAVDGDSTRLRAPSTGVSMRCSIPVIQAGFSRISRARPSAASTIAAAPSVIGAMS